MVTKLRVWQKQSGYTVSELARRCGVSHASMSQKLDGIRSISEDERVVLARACHKARESGMRVDPVFIECIDTEPARYRAKEAKSRQS